MTQITLVCQGGLARARVDGPITQGMVGIPVTLECDGAWAGLSKTLKARCGGEVRTTTVPDTGPATLPYECLMAGHRLDIGLDGWDENGLLRIPTNWACCALVEPSVAEADGEPGAVPVPPADMVSQIYQRVEQVEQSVETLTQQVTALPQQIPTVTEQTVTGWGFTKNTGEYTKPQGGIPESDLAAAVQTKLNTTGTAVPDNVVLYEEDSSTQEDLTMAELLDNLTLVSDGDFIYLRYGNVELGRVDAASGAATVYCTGISIQQENLTLSLGDTQQRYLTAAVTPAGCTQTLRWISDNTAAVQIDSTGALTIVGEGTATVTARCGAYSDSVTVTVRETRKTFDIVSGGVILSGTSAAVDEGRTDRVHTVPLLMYVGDGATVKLNCTNTDFYFGMSGYLHSDSTSDLNGASVATSGRIIDPGWKQGEYTVTASGWTHLAVNFKKSSGASFTEEDITALKSAFSIEVT